MESINPYNTLIKNTLLTGLLFVILLLSSCKPKSSPNLVNNIEYDTLSINLNENTLNSYTLQSATSTIRGKEFFIGFNPKLNMLDVFDLDQNTYSHSVAVSLQGPNAIPGLLSFNFYDDYRIFQSQTGFFITNTKGEIIKSVPVKKLEQQNYSSSFRGVTVNNFNRLSLDTKHRRVYFPVISSQYAPTESAYFDQRCIGALDLDSDSVIILDIPYPPVIKSGYYAGLSIPYITAKGDSIIYNFPASSQIFIYNCLTQKLSSVDAKSTQTSNTSPTIDKNADIGAQYRYRLESRQFFPVEYDPSRNLYYRAHYDEMHVDKLPFNRTLFLTIMDESFNVVKELTLSDQLYPFFHVSRKGILFQYTLGMEGEELNFLVVRPIMDTATAITTPTPAGQCKDSNEQLDPAVGEVKAEIKVEKTAQQVTITKEKPAFSYDNLQAFTMKHMKKNLRYPPEALKAGQEGVVQVYLIYDQDQKLKRIELAGDTIMGFKEEAMRIAKLLPKDLDIGDNSIVSFPVIFQLVKK